jgi:hypothetical protein
MYLARYLFGKMILNLNINIQNDSKVSQQRGFAFVIKSNSRICIAL